MKHQGFYCEDLQKKMHFGRTAYIEYARVQGAEKVTVLVSKENVPSNRVAVKCGRRIIAEKIYKKRGTDITLEEYLYEVLL